MRPEGVILPAPAIDQAIELSHRGEKFDVEELIPEPAVELFSEPVLSSVRGRLKVILYSTCRAWSH